MVNSSEFSERLKKVMDYYNLSASAFADRINVQRSSISHLLSERNKPSLDFVLKVIHEFREVELYWLLIGKGSFPKKEASPLLQEQNTSKPITNIAVENSAISGSGLIDEEKYIERIVIFYSDGTFKEYLK